MRQIVFERDALFDGWNQVGAYTIGYTDTRKSDYKESKELLISVMMKKYNITEEDLHDINTVKTKLRDINIGEILK